MSQHYLAMCRRLWASPQFFVTCSGAWIGIVALSMSPALAQVNGPGPSPSELFDTVYNLPGDEASIPGNSTLEIGGVLGETTQLNVSDGGMNNRRSIANFGSEVNISGGTVGTGFRAESGSEVNISGGTVGGVFNESFSAGSGSTVNISGGVVSVRFIAASHSSVEISGGMLDLFSASSGSNVNVSGGSFGRFTMRADSNVELIGGEFRLNGVDVSDSTITLAENDILIGTFADGAPFIFNDAALDTLANVGVSTVTLPSANLNPITVDATVVSGPSGLRAGQTLTLQAGGSLVNNFAVVDAELNVNDGILGEFAKASNSVVNISGGTVGQEFKVFGSEVNISGGTVGYGFDASSGSTVNINDGTVDSSFTANNSDVNISGGNVDSLVASSGSEVNVSGGTLRNVMAKSGSDVNISGGTLDFVEAESGSDVNINGGTVRSHFSLDSGGTAEISGGTFLGLQRFLNNMGVLNISGGTFTTDIVNQSEVNISGGIFDGSFRASRAVSALNIFGGEFAIDGVDLDALQLGQRVTITDRDVTLSGVLVDGEPFSFDLNTANSDSSDYFFPGATVTVTLTAPFVLGDCNQDGAVDFLDISTFITILRPSSFLREADCNQDGVVNLLDIGPFILILSGI